VQVQRAGCMGRGVALPAPSGPRPPGSSTCLLVAKLSELCPLAKFMEASLHRHG
jgi:hypothetical protein